YRFRWPAPIAGSPHDPKVIYHAANIVFRTADGGQTWTAISPDLTRNDKRRQQWSGGPITGDNTTAEYYCTISAVAESPKQKGLLYVGTERGVIVSPDDGKTWQPLQLNLPTVPVHDLVVKNDDLVLGTHGHSLWIFDDLTPIRRFGPASAAKPAEIL